MRTKETKVYKFGELSEYAKNKAIENLYDLNVDYEWWNSTYDDAENIGLKITEFDLDRGAYVRGNFIGIARETAEKIIAEHGEKCETVATAKNYLKELKLQNQICLDRISEEKESAKEDGLEYEGEEFDPDDIDIEDIDKEFLRSLLEDYRIILQHEYDYCTSREAIVESIEANEYEFTENGKLA